MATKVIREQFAFSGGKVRRPGVDGFTGKYPVIEGVLLCGPNSLNGRDYPGAAFPANKKLYEGRPIYVNHSNNSRLFQEKLGWIENESRRADGMPIGNIGIHPLHPEAERVLWAAENKPDFAGFSHVAKCDSRTGPNGRESVRRVLEIESTDLVVDPATTKGFFESKGRTMKITIKTLSERLMTKLGTDQQSRLKKLLEMEGVPAAEVDEPAEDDSADKSLEDALCTLAVSVMKAAIAGDITADEAGSKFAAFIKTHKGEAAEPEPDDDETESEESVKKKPGKPDPIREALEVCAKVGHRPDADELETIAATPSAKREAVAKKFKLFAEGAVGTPTSGPRGVGTPKPGDKVKESQVPSDLSKLDW